MREWDKKKVKFKNGISFTLKTAAFCNFKCRTKFDRKTLKRKQTHFLGKKTSFAITGSDKKHS